MIEAVQFNMTVRRRDDINLPFYVTENGVKKDITGWTGKMEVRDSPGGPTAYLTLTATPTANGSAITVSDAANGIMLIVVQDTDILALPANADATKARVFSYDVRVKQGAGAADQNVWFFGSLTVEPGVSA